MVYASLAPIALFFLDPEGCHSLAPWLLKIILSSFVSGSVPFSELAEMLADMVGRAGAGSCGPGSWARAGHILQRLSFYIDQLPCLSA